MLFGEVIFYNLQCPLFSTEHSPALESVEFLGWVMFLFFNKQFLLSLSWIWSAFLSKGKSPGMWRKGDNSSYTQVGGNE